MCAFLEDPTHDTSCEWRPIRNGHVKVLWPWWGDRCSSWNDLRPLRYLYNCKIELQTPLIPSQQVCPTQSQLCHRRWHWTRWKMTRYKIDLKMLTGRCKRSESGQKPNISQIALQFDILCSTLNHCVNGQPSQQEDGVNIIFCLPRLKMPWLSF